RELRSRPRHLVAEPARLSAGLPVCRFQRRRRDRRRPALDRAPRCRADRLPQRALQGGGLMGVRLLGLGARMAILLVFAIFFVAPILWLPPRTPPADAHAR